MNASNETDTDDYELSLTIQISFGCACVLLGLCTFGILGNIASIMIFAHSRMRSPINILLCGLSIADMLLLILAIPAFALQGLNGYINDIRLSQLGVYTIVFLYPLAATSQTASVWLLMIITLERYVAVCHPLVAMRYCTLRRAVTLLLIVWATALVYNVPRFFEFRLKYNAQTSFTEAPEALRNNSIYYYVYYTTLYLITHFMVPFTILLIMHSYVVWAIRKAKKQRREISRSQEREHKTAHMMVIVVTAFALCNTIPFILNIVEGVQRDLFKDPSTSSVAYAVMDISNLLVVAYSASTCLIYYFFSQKYKQTFHWIFCHSVRYQRSYNGTKIRADSDSMINMNGYAPMSSAFGNRTREECTDLQPSRSFAGSKQYGSSLWPENVPLKQTKLMP